MKKKNPLDKDDRTEPPKAIPRSQQLFKCICGEFDRLTNQCKLCDACSHCCKCKVKAVPDPEPEQTEERIGEQDAD